MKQFLKECECGLRLVGVYEKRKGYLFKCAKCGRRYRGGLWIRLVWEMSKAKYEDGTKIYPFWKTLFYWLR